MPTPADSPIITVFMVVLFVLGVLYNNWLAMFRDWIKQKVSET
jgi:hypothetical protein